MTACNTGFDEGIISTNGQIDSYRLSYLRRKHWKISGNVDSSNQLSKHDPLVRQDTFRGDNVDNSTTAVTNPDGLRDAGSMASDDSKRMIIRREVGWQVAVESSRPASTRVS